MNPEVHDLETEGLEPRKHLAIVALLRSPTFEAAAEECGVHERTLRRWLSDDEAFRKAYNRRLRTFMEHTSSQLQRATSKAVATLEAIMDDGEASANARATAARSVLEYAYRAAEQAHIIERIDALENAAQRRGMSA